MRVFVKILVNLITTFRFLITIFLMSIFRNINEIEYLVLIVCLLLSDFIDGRLARRFRVQTFYGSNMDTIADKALFITLMLLLLEKIPIIWFPLFGEILIAFVNVIGKVKGKKTESSNLGKIKTWIVSITIILCYVYYFHFIHYFFVFIGCGISFILQIFVLFYYVKFLKVQVNQSKKKSYYSFRDILYYLFSTDYYLKHN